MYRQHTSYSIKKIIVIQFLDQKCKVKQSISFGFGLKQEMEYTNTYFVNSFY